MATKRRNNICKYCGKKIKKPKTKSRKKKTKKRSRKNKKRTSRRRRHRVLGSALRRGAGNIARQSRPVFRNITNAPPKPKNLDKKVLEKMKDLYELDDKYRDNAIKMYNYKPPKKVYNLKHI